MRLIDNKVKKLQTGGQMAPEAAPAAPQQDQMMAQIEQMAAEIINSLGMEGAAVLAETIMAMLQSQAPVEQMPQGQAVFAKGGKLLRRVK